MEKKQIPGGNDRKKGKDKDKGQCRDLSTAQAKDKSVMLLSR